MKIRRWLSAFSAASLIMGATVIVGTTGIAGADITVTNTADSGADSLRDVLENDVVDGDTVVLVAGATYTLDDCEGGYIVVTAAVTIQGNGATIEQTCRGDRVIDLKNVTTIDGVTITGGTMDGEGGGIFVDADEDFGALTLRNSTVTGNVASGDGGGIGGSGPITIIDSTISGNSTAQDGGGLANEDDLRVIRSSVTGNCAEDDGGALDGDGDATFVNSTVSGNTFDDQGAIAMDDGVLTLVYSTIVANTLEDDVDCDGVTPVEASADDVDGADTGEPSNVQVGSGGMRIFGTVIALPIDVNPGSPGAFNCKVEQGAGVTSSGHNYSDDDTCELAASTDKQNAADPMLGTLAANGGPTFTHLPLAGSPLINAIPIANCGDGNTIAGGPVTTDQRGVSRPQETGCEIGSVEIAAPPPIVVTPTFTG